MNGLETLIVLGNLVAGMNGHHCFGMVKTQQDSDAVDGLGLTWNYTVDLALKVSDMTHNWLQMKRQVMRSQYFLILEDISVSGWMIEDFECMLNWSDFVSVAQIQMSVLLAVAVDRYGAVC